MKLIDHTTSSTAHSRQALSLTRILSVLTFVAVVNITLVSPALADSPYGSGAYGQGGYGQGGSQSNTDGTSSSSLMPPATNGAASPENSPQSSAIPGQGTPTQGVSVQPSNSSQPQANTSPASVRQENSTMLWILGGVLLLLVTAIGLVLWRLKRRAPEA